MRRRLLFAILGLGLLGAPRVALAQTGYGTTYRVSDYFVAPGLYGTSYGYASYGVPRTYTAFSAFPNSAYYGTNLPPYGYLPGRYGVGLWRPGFTAPGYVFGEPTTGSSYRTFPVVHGTTLTADQIAPRPSIGVYAPALGPGLGRSGR